MPTFPINITGGTYKHKSLPLSSQVTRNFIPQLQEDDSVKSAYILEPYPGLKSFTTTTGTVDRGMLFHQGVLYKITGTNLYSVDQLGVPTLLGTIPGVDRCIIIGAGTSVIIVSTGVAYEWDGTTLTTGSDVDFETPTAAAFMNQFTIYDGDDGRFGVSNVGDPLNIDGLNYATAEVAADALIRPYAYDQTLYQMGEKTIEPWWNSGVGNPPFDRIEQGTMPIGLGALHSPAHTDQFLYILDDDNQIQAIQGSSHQVVTPKAIVRAFSQYAVTSDAIGWTYNFEGQWFYQLTFPSADKTWVYPEGGEIFEISSGSDGGRSIANSYAYAYRKHLVADHRNGNIYELDAETYDDVGEALIRTRDTGPLHGGLFGAPGKNLEMERFELIMETGSGLTAGQGSDPVVMLSFSDDGGRTFSEEEWGQIGKIGEYKTKVEWFALGTFESRIMRVRISDPVYCSIHSAAADIEIGI